MKVQQTSLPSAGTFGGIPSALSVLIAYQDVEAGLRARKVLDRILESLGTEANCDVRLWKFGWLTFQDCREEALEDGSRADLILLSARGDQPPSPELKHWLTTSLGQHSGGARALALLLDEGSQGTPIANDWLRFARTLSGITGAELFTGFEHAPTAETQLVIQQIHRRATESSPILEDILHRPV